MLTTTWRQALAAALLTALLTLPVLGLRLVPGELGIRLEWHGQAVALAMLCVFIAQLAAPHISARYRAWRALRTASAAPSASLLRLQRLPQSAVWLLILTICMLLPFSGSRAATDIATLALIYAVLALGLNIVVGFAGLLDLGYVGFYAIGAYTYAIFNTALSWSFWTCLPLAAGMAALAGFLLGFPVLRLRGDYLAIVTLGFGEIIRLLLNNLSRFTGGPDGINGIAKPSVFGIDMVRHAREAEVSFHQLLGLTYNGRDMVTFLYFLALLLAIAAYLITRRLRQMPLGRAWRAMRDDEIACRALGLNPARLKLAAFTLGAAFAGVAGAFFAARQGLVTPESFGFMESALILAMVVLGGMGSPAGVILAALLLTILPELARNFSEYRMLLFGLVMVFMMRWRPQGLLPARVQTDVASS